MKNTKNQSGAVSPSILVGIGVGVVVVVLLILFFATDVFNKSSDNTNTAATTTKTSTASPALSLGTTPYTDDTYNYSIQFPEAWERDTDENITAIYTAEETDSSKAVLITINAATFEETITQDIFDEVVTESRKALKEFTDLEYTADKSNTKGTTFGHIFEHDTTQEGVELHSLQMIYMKDNNSYVLTGQTLTGSWPDFQKSIEATFGTFKIL